MKKTTTKVGIVGTGFVGSSIAYAMINQGITNELFLIDVNNEKAKGEAHDLSDGIGWGQTNVTVFAGDYNDCKDADIMVITAGINQKPGQSRLDLVDTNAKIMTDITNSIMASGFDGILVIASNPVDVLTYVAWKASGLPHSRVIGTGTTLDTTRLKSAVAAKLAVDPRCVHGYIIGEHGDSETAVWSHTTIGGKNIREWDGITEEVLETMYVNVRDAAYDIIDKKQATYYGIGMSTTHIVKAVLNNEQCVLPISAYQQGEYGVDDVFTGTPAIVGQEGVREIIALPISDSEHKQFLNSVDQLKTTIRSIK
ncbi:L-lactate dehydrogenase 2 [Brochothrix thermosphacta]|uniref:L-lactate dehydrogenase n=1 Tax=Brochothrix thermosphacta TaxID=2756 RepID=UPI000D0FA17F|nr:L-lactate dehydrogenase [Brochothrix thermosphacta]SOC27139.1 L-lactate dehydrogenase 2 [Brochothrix thermosphacta]